MADNEMIAATLAAGMLPSAIPPAMERAGIVDKDEQDRFLMDVFHAVALYRAVLEALGRTEHPVRIGGGVCAGHRRDHHMRAGIDDDSSSIG
jgi:hypothetical protein